MNGTIVRPRDMFYMPTTYIYMLNVFIRRWTYDLACIVKTECSEKGLFGIELSKSSLLGGGSLPI